MDNDTRFGLLLPAGGAQAAQGMTAERLVEFAVGGERLGFDSLWLGDSLARGRLEPLTLLATLAGLTERVTLGTAALMPAYRDPLQAAQTLATLDLLSHGRLVLGVGAGFPRLSEPEFAAVGVDFRTRFSWLDDAVALWRQLWSTSDEARPKEFHGKVLHYDWLPQVTPPHRPGGPPIWLAGATPAALARTGRHYDGWLPYPPDVADFASGVATIRAAAEAAGRDPDAITPALFATVLIEDDAEKGRRGLDEYCQANYRMPVTTVEQIQVLITGSRDQVAERLREYEQAGARHILLRIATVDPDICFAQRDALADLLLPARQPTPSC